MTDDEALVRAVVAHPDDDTPRLVYADWLEETGRPDRAAFVRAQVDAARAEPWTPARRRATAAAARLLDRHRDDWHPAWAGGMRVEYARGFVERVVVDPDVFPVVADTVFANAPVRALGFRRNYTIEEPGFRPPTLAPALAVPGLRQLVRLELDSLALTPEDAYALGDCPHLAGLRELSLRNNAVPPSWVADVLAGPKFPHLESLDLAEIANLGPAVVRGLLRAKHRRLRAVDLSGMGSLDSDGLQAVLNAPVLERVEELRLRWGGDPMRPGPLTHLDMGWVLPWRALRLLDLSGQGVGAKGVAELARAADAAHLRWLGLAANQIGTDGVTELVESRHLRLYHLDVRHNGVTRKQLAALRARFPEARVQA